MTAACEQIDTFIRERQPHYYVAVNAAKVVECQRDKVLRDAIEEAHLSTADGEAVVWAARLLGQTVPERVAGIDLMQSLLAHAAERGYSVYWLGATAPIVDACVAKARVKYPTLRIVGHRDGYFRGDEEPGIVETIRAAAPDILLLGFGTPAKEYFMRRHYRALDVPFVMGVGGSFDVFAGQTARAPRWMQRAGLEWMFRLVQEPRRLWKRYLVGNTLFVNLVVRELIARRSKP